MFHDKIQFIISTVVIPKGFFSIHILPTRTASRKYNSTRDILINIGTL